MVDLPQPEGPSRAMNSPCLTVSVTSWSAFTRAEVAADPVEPQFAKVGAWMRHLASSFAADLLVPAAEG